MADICLLAMIVVHDADHVRQAVNWCYTIPLSVWIVNVLVYVPGLLSLWLAWHWRTIAALATCVSGVLIAVAFAKVHLWKPFLPVWGIWNESFLVLGVDAISWSILTLTVLVGVGVSLAGAFVAGRISHLSQ